jgi:threonine dehydratase
MDGSEARTVTLDDVRAAAARIRGHVRRTPLLQPEPLKDSPVGEDTALWLKLECLQVTGSFKARGASSKLGTLGPDDLARGIVTASGGNHGLAVAYAGWVANTPATIYLPRSTPPAKAEKLEKWGARVVFEGEVWDEANETALAVAEREGLTYIHPFADPAVIAGQGTTTLEILEDAPEVDTLVIAIGGGGLISGMAAAAKALDPALRVIGVEPVGAPTLRKSVDAGELVTLDKIETAAGTLAPRRSETINLEIISACVDDIVLVSDEEMRAAARWLWFELGIAAELSGAAAVAALQTGRVAPAANICALICGAGTDGIG